MLVLVLENTMARREIDNKAISLKNLAGLWHDGSRDLNIFGAQASFPSTKF